MTLPVDPVAQVDNRCGAGQQAGTLLTQREIQMRFDPNIDRLLPGSQNGTGIRKEREVVHIPEVPAHLQLTLDELVEGIQKGISPYLGGEQPNRQATSPLRLKQRVRQVTLDGGTQVDAVMCLHDRAE